MLQVDGAALLEDVERLGPEFQPEDVAFPREQVVVDVHPRHRLQVAADDPIGDEGADIGGFVSAMLDVVQRLGAVLQPILVLFVPLRHARVEIPAVEIEAGGIRDAANLLERLALEHPEADDDVGDLDAGVVDVVLHFDRDAAEPEDAHQGVAERGIPQVADVRRFVRIDRRVLDDRLGGRRRGRRGGRQPIEQKTAPFEEEVQIAVGRGRHARDAFERAERAGDFLRNRPRRLPQPPRQLEGDRRAKIAEFAVWRVIEDDRGRLRRRRARTAGRAVA